MQYLPDSVSTAHGLATVMITELAKFVVIRTAQSARKWLTEKDIPLEIVSPTIQRGIRAAISDYFRDKPWFTEAVANRICILFYDPSWLDWFCQQVARAKTRTELIEDILKHPELARLANDEADAIRYLLDLIQMAVFSAPGVADYISNQKLDRLLESHGHLERKLDVLLRDRAQTEISSPSLDGRLVQILSELIETLSPPRKSGRSLFTKIDHLMTILSFRDHYHIDLHISDDRQAISLRPRFDGAEQECPLEVLTTFMFPDTEEGRKKRKEFERFLHYGVPVDLGPEFVLEARTKLGGTPLEKLGPCGISLGTIDPPSLGNLLPVRVERIHNSGTDILIPFLHLHRQSSGQRGAILVDELANAGFEIHLEIDVVDKRGVLTASLPRSDCDCVEALPLIEFLGALNNSTSVRFINLSDNATLFEMDTSGGEFVQLAPLAFYRNLAFIQEATGTRVPNPLDRPITWETLLLVDRIACAMREGCVSPLPLNATMHLHLFTPQQIAAFTDRKTLAPFKASLESYEVQILGSTITLGPYEIEGPATPTNVSYKRIRKALEIGGCTEIYSVVTFHLSCGTLRLKDWPQ